VRHALVELHVMMWIQKLTVNQLVWFSSWCIPDADIVCLLC